MTGGRLSGIQVENLAAAILKNDGYRVVQAHARTTHRLEGNQVKTVRKHDFLQGRFDHLAFNDAHCLRVQAWRGQPWSEKLVQASGPTPTYCIDEAWRWADDNSGFARKWKTEGGWRDKDPVRVDDPHAILARADTSLDEVEP